MLKYTLRQGDLIKDFNIPLKLKNSFDPTALKYDIIDNQMNNETYNYVSENSIIDVEKVRIRPALIKSVFDGTSDYGKDEFVTNIESLTFNLNLLDSYKFNYVIPSNYGMMGFTNSNIINKDESLKNSLLRLLFFDSKNPANQNLLAFSNIYIDTTKLYYDLYNSNMDISKVKTEFITYNPLIANSYDNTDGFYLYLYNTDIIKNSITNIYMKAEFYNSKTGKKIIFAANRSSINGFSLSELFDNMYYDVSIRYINNNIYYIIEQINRADSSEGKIKLDLYEANIK